MNIDFRVYPHFYEDICKDDDTFITRQEVLNIHNNSTASISHIKNQMRLANLDFLVLHAQDENSVDGKTVLSNEEVSSLAKSYPDMFIAVASVDPKDENSSEKLINAFDNLDMKALRLNLSRLDIDPDDKRILKLLDVCSEKDKNVIFETGISYDRGYAAKYSNPALYENLIIKYPNLKFCFTRCGWPWTRETIMLLMKYRNVYTDTGLLYFDSAREFYNYLLNQEFQKTWIDRSLSHQIMFASENPRFEQIRMSNVLQNMDFHKTTMDRIMGGNAREFLGVDYE